MVEFKFYDKKEKKFVSPYRGSENVWKARYKLGIWDKSIHDDNLNKMYNLVKNNNNFELYFKLNNSFVLANNVNIKEFLKDTKKNNKKNNKTRKENFKNNRLKLKKYILERFNKSRKK